MPKPLLCNPKPFKDQFRRDVKERRERRYCFILGAGASVSSGIPSGKALADQWLREIHERQCPPPSSGQKSMSLVEWCAYPDCPVPGIDPTNPGAHYPQLFLARFPGCDPEGQRFIQESIRGGSKEHPNIPSIGYAYLALLLQQTDSRVVITTNFDNLAADSLLLFTGTLPRVVGHERVASFAGLRDGQPLIGKIHGDVGFVTANDPDGVAKLPEEWHGPLRDILRDHIPVFIGYDGNDGSLMDFLCTQMFESGSGATGRSLFRSGLYWCYRAGEGRDWKTRVAENARLEKLTDSHQVHFVPIGDFDLWMMELGEACGVDDPEQILRANADRRVKSLAEQISKARGAQAAPAPDPAVEASRAETREEIGKRLSEWDFLYKAQAEKDPKKADKLFLKAIELAPESPSILFGYAVFLTQTCKKHDRAQEFFERAIAADPNDANALSNFALFLIKTRKDHDWAQQLYERAIKAEPNNGDILRKYAIFLTTVRKDHNQAQDFFERALKADPNSARNLASYGHFLMDIRIDHRRANELYERALRIDQNDPNTLRNYAIFLTIVRKDYDRACKLFERALKVDPNNAVNLSQFAVFLANFRKDYKRSHELHERAINEDPFNAAHLGNFATFLANIRKDYNRAQELFERALEVDPNNAIALTGFAHLLSYARHHHDRAQELYQRAVNVEPSHGNILSNFAVFLSKVRKDYTGARAYHERAIKADPNNANVLGNFAEFLLSLAERDEGMVALTQAIAALSEQEGVLGLDVEVWFYAYAHRPAAERREALSTLKKLLLEKGSRSLDWDFSRNIERAVQANHPEAAWLPKLAEVINGKSDPSILSGWLAWKNA